MNAAGYGRVNKAWDEIRRIGQDVRFAADRREPITIDCPDCGHAMRVKAEHLRIPVACPHCDAPLAPKEVAAMQSVATPPDGLPAVLPAHVVYSWRNRWVAGLLGLFLGAFGVHRFYLGYVGIGILQIFVTIITGGIAGLWGLIEGILILAGGMMRDVDGLRLRE